MVELYDSGDYVNLYGQIKKAFPIKRVEVVSNFIKNKNIYVNNYLDLACGTGFFLDLLQQKMNFNSCVGLDYSVKMLEYANNHHRSKNIEYVYGDMSCFSLDKKFEFISCNYDAINFLQTIEEWVKTFKCVYNHLSKGGIFTFDFNTIKKMKAIKNGWIFKENDCCDIVEYADNNNKKINIKYTIYRKQDDLYHKEVFSLTESVIKVKQVVKALKEAGFKNIKLCDENFKKCNVKKLYRAFAICYK